MFHWVTFIHTSTKLRLPFLETFLLLFPKSPHSFTKGGNSLLIADSTIFPGIVILVTLQFPRYLLKTLQCKGVMLAISQASVTEDV